MVTLHIERLWYKLVRDTSITSFPLFLCFSSGGEGSAETGQKETSTCDICQFGAECDVDAEDVWWVCERTQTRHNLFLRATWHQLSYSHRVGFLRHSLRDQHWEFRLKLSFIMHTAVDEHPLSFSAWLTISFNLNYQSRAQREREIRLFWKSNYYPYRT